MSVVFNNYWADRFWATAGREQAFARTSRVDLDSLSWPNTNRLETLPAPFNRFRQDANIIMAKQCPRSGRRKVCARVCTWVPPKSFVHVSSGYYVVSPEFLFVELARRLSLEQLIAVGYEFCGTYAIDPESGKASFAALPISNLAKLSSFIESAKGMPGAPRARQALRYVHENSASPMETASCMRIGLPCMYGGYNIGGMLLNYPVPLSETAAAVYRHSKCLCDIYFPEIRRDLEFHGAYHLNTKENDWAREDALQLMGVVVTPVTYAQYCDNRAFAAIAKGIAKELGLRVRRGQLEWDDRKRLLVAQLDRYLGARDRFQPLLP